MIRPRQPAERGPGLVYGLALPFYQQVRLGVASPTRVQHLLGRLAPTWSTSPPRGRWGSCRPPGARRLGVPVASSFHTNFDYAGHYGFLGVDRVVFGYLRAGFTTARG